MTFPPKSARHRREFLSLGLTAAGSVAVSVRRSAAATVMHREATTPSMPRRHEVVSYNGTAEIIVTDLDEDRDKDILVAGKTGVHWQNLRADQVPAQVREQQLLLNGDWPFAGESGPNSPAGQEH